MTRPYTRACRQTNFRGRIRKVSPLSFFIFLSFSYIFSFLFLTFLLFVLFSSGSMAIWVLGGGGGGQGGQSDYTGEMVSQC